MRDVHHGLKGNKLKVSLNVEYMPFVGFFFKVSFILKIRLDFTKPFFKFLPTMSTNDPIFDVDYYI